MFFFSLSKLVHSSSLARMEEGPKLKKARKVKKRLTIEGEGRGLFENESGTESKGRLSSSKVDADEAMKVEDTESGKGDEKDEGDKAKWAKWPGWERIGTGGRPQVVWYHPQTGRLWCWWRNQGWWHAGIWEKDEE